ncbi:Methionine aminopeptidase [Candidatus Roizmanbacteria bacterium]|nr:Methionine aminopeptidase [Candidatus Roizmanbacteria bacterium]
MNTEDLKKYKKVQTISREIIQFLRSFIKEGQSEKEIAEEAEKFMKQKGINSYWYYNLGAMVFVGKRTTISISGKDYQPTDLKVKSEDLVTVDLAPEIDGFWGDYARSFVIVNGKVGETEQSKIPEIVQGINTETIVHKEFQNFIKEEMELQEAYAKMNLFIDKLGFENLDFKKNLGHSIEKNIDDRKYIEAGNNIKFGEIDLFTFEPHLKKKNGYYGVRLENIYYFNKGKIQIL